MAGRHCPVLLAASSSSASAARWRSTEPLAASKQPPAPCLRRLNANRNFCEKPCPVSRQDTQLAWARGNLGATPSPQSACSSCSAPSQQRLLLAAQQRPAVLRKPSPHRDDRSLMHQLDLRPSGELLGGAHLGARPPPQASRCSPPSTEVGPWSTRALQPRQRHPVARLP